MSAILDTSDVHLGHWVNWSLGTIRGSTITLTRKDGSLFLAFVAVFVTFAGSRMWKVATFCIYLCLSTDSNQDGLFHQRQAVLRNSSTADTTFWNLVTIAWAWRNSKSSAFKRLAPLALVSLVSGLAFAIAGVFSAQISFPAGNEVLLAGTRCAGINFSSFDAAEFQTVVQPYLATLIQSSAQRAQQCYNTNATSEDCPTFIQPSLHTSIIRNASCPFDAKICQSNTTNLIIDTGLINSHNDLGINSPPGERFSFRILTHCAPLVTDGKYSGVVEDPIDGFGKIVSLTNQTWIQYYYGGRIGVPGPQSINLTYQYPQIDPSSASAKVITAFQRDYSISATFARANNTDPETADFITIPELSLVDADTGLFFLSANSVRFAAPVDDLWYSAQSSPKNISDVGDSTAGAGNYSVWFADRPTNVLGCSYQAQFCNPLLPAQQGCSPLMSLLSTVLLPLDTDRSELSSLFKGRQLNRVIDFLDTLSEFVPGLESIVDMQGAAALTGRKNFANGLQGPLPSNQWQLDVESWVSTQLATIQRMPIEFANGPDWPGIELFLESPLTNKTDVERDFCTSQKIISTDYTSFSTLGLTLTFVIGGIFIVLSYLLPPILHWVQRCFRWDNYALTEWSTNETLQLQSLAHEGFGAGTWTRKIGWVPTTLPKELLATLDLSDPEHPLLKAPQRSWDETLEAGLEGEKATSAQVEGARISSDASSAIPESDVTSSGSLHSQHATSNMPFEGV